MKLATGTRNDKAEAFGALLDGGYIEFRSGTIPANPQATATGTLLLSYNLTNPAFASAVAGVITMAAQTIQLVTTTGTVAWARLFTAGDVVVADASVGTSSSDILVPSTTFTLSDGKQITVLTYTQPES